MSSKDPEGGSSVQEFIWKLEASAKRVLKDANKKAREAQLAEQMRSIQEGQKTVAAVKAKTAKGMLKDGSVKMAHTKLSSSMDMSDVQSMGRMPPGTDTLEMRYSVPKMFVSMAMDNAATANLLHAGHMSMRSPRASSSGGLGGTLSPIKKKGGGAAQMMSQTTDATDVITKAPRRNKVLEALGSSAYVSGATGTLEEIMLARRQEAQKLKESRKKGSEDAPEQETSSNLKSHVTSVMSGKNSGATKLHRKLIKQRADKLAGGAAGRKSEKQGPIDWSTNGLKMKYRGEAEREGAFRSWETANAYAQQAIEEQEIVIPIAKITRHPLFTQFYEHIKGEQNGARLRTRARLLMKRFVFDVHEVWLTNLQHLREHQPARLMRQNDAGPTFDADGHEHEKGVELESAAERGYGLSGRRDHRAIDAMEAQIQSVSLKKSLEKAYYTTHMPEPKTVLNFIPAETPDPVVPRALPPSLENLVDGLYVKTIDADTSVDPNNKRVGIPEIALFVDRLLPPSDAKEPEPGELHAETLWRFTAYRREDVSMLYYVTTEKRIMAFARQLEAADEESSKAAQAALNMQAPEEGQEVTPGQIELQTLIAHPGMQEVFTKEDIDLPWSIMDVGVEMRVFVGRKGGDMGNIQIKLVALLKGDFDGNVVIATVSPIELRYILVKPGIPLNDLAWWRSSERATDLWQQILNSLYVIDGDVNEYGDPDPCRIGFNCEKTPADRVSGALTTAKALQVVQDVLCAVRVDSKCRLHVEGSGPNFFINADDTEKRFFGLKLDDEDARTNLSQVNANFKIVVDHSNDPPFNIGSLQDKLERLKFVAAIKAGKQSLDEDSVGGEELSVTSAAEGVEETKHDSNSEDMLAKFEFNEGLRTGYWDKVLDDRCSTLSMIATGYLANVAQVPGACEMGKMGLWFDHQMYREYTQPCANFFRDAKISTTDTVLVNMSLSLDTSMIFPTVLAWEDFSQLPPKCVAEEIDGVVPAILALPGTLVKEPLISPLDERVSQLSSIFGTLPEEGVDHIPLDAPNKPLGMMRQWEFVNPKGFRQKIVATLLGVDPVLPTVVFGITRNGAQPNTPGVNPRNIWHNPLAITEHINRPRSSKDYHYLIINSQSQGANDPATFTTRMKAGECVGLSSSAFRTFEKEYEEIKLRREIFARQLALDSKIENSVIALKTREMALKADLQRELQRGIEKKLRKATKSEKGWSRRFYTSQILELQGNWERRLDEKSGQIFFRAIAPGGKNMNLKKEKFLETCQWEVPATWDGDPLYLPGDEYGEDMDDMASVAGGGGSVGSGVGSALTGAFDQPPDSWHPGLDDDANAKAAFSDARTPGNKTKVAIGARIQDNQLPAHAQAGARNKQHGSGKSVGFNDNSSVFAERSMGETEAPTINTANLEHIAEQLVSSDELMRVLARRLGLNVDNVVPAEELSVFSVSVASEGNRLKAGSNDDMGNEAILAPRDHNEDFEDGMDSDDDMWSDDEQEVGNHDASTLGELPQDHFDKNTIRKRNMREGQSETPSVPGSVPYLNLAAAVNHEEEGEALGVGWRKLARPDIPEKFFDKCNITQTLGPDKGSCNTFNVPVFLMPISPVDACQYEPDNFSSNVESIFIPDAKKDMERSMATVERNIKREEDLARNVPTDDLLLFGTAAANTKADQYVAKQFKEDQNAFVDPKEGAMRKAILAAKSNNIAEMEDALEEDIGVNTADTFGNTLLILAAQQGSKRMCKFLLRRGANINMQALSGNTALHYCYAYSQFALGEYLKSKGANDSILNIDKMTCYEGLSSDALKEEGDESEEEEDDM